MQDIARWGVIGPLFVIPFVVLFVPSDLFFLFITGKGFAFRILVEIAFASWVILALLDPKYRPRFSWTLALYGALVLWMVVANALAVSPMKAFWGNFERMEGWITILHVFLFLVVMGSFLSAEALWRRWWLAFLAASAVVSLYSLVQIMCAGQACGEPGRFFQIHQGGARVDGTLGNAIYLAQYLIFAIGIAAWQAIVSKGALRWWLIALAALHLVIFFFTATRGSILAAFIAVALGALWYAVEEGGLKRRVALGALAVLMLLGAGLFLSRDASWVQTEPTLARLVSVFSAEEWQTRFTIWGIAGEGFIERPVTGWGQEGFNYVFNAHYKPSLFGQEQWFDRAHNLYLDWLIAGGLPALLLIVSILLTGMYALYRRADRTARIFLIGMLFAYAVQSLSAFDNLFTYIPVAAALAYAHSLGSRPIRRIEGVEADETLVANLGVPIAVVTLVTVFWLVHVPGIRAANDLILGMTPSADMQQNLAYFKRAASRGVFTQEVSEQTVNFATQVVQAQNVPVGVRAQFAEQAITEIERELARRPLDARIYMEASLAYRAIGNYDEAIVKSEAALALSPDKQSLMVDLGTLEWQRGNVEKASEWFLAAYALKPSAEQLAIYAAIGHVITGDTEAADALLVERFGTAVLDNDLLVYGYFNAKQYGRAAAILEARFEKEPNPTTGFQLASVYALMERDADARRVLDEVIRAFPETRTQADLLYEDITKP